MAYGDVLHHMGDVFGPVVNLASRLTSVARPGSAVIDRGWASCSPTTTSCASSACVGRP